MAVLIPILDGWHGVAVIPHQNKYEYDCSGGGGGGLTWLAKMNIW